MQAGARAPAQGDPHIPAQPRFVQPVGDSGMIPSLLPSLSSGSFTNRLPSCLGGGVHWGRRRGLPHVPPASACHQLRPAAALLPCPGMKHWCGHRQGSAGVAHRHCRCHCCCEWHLPLLLCASMAAVDNVHLTRGWCNTVPGYPMMLFAQSYSTGLVLRCDFDC